MARNVDSYRASDDGVWGINGQAGTGLSVDVDFGKRKLLSPTGWTTDYSTTGASAVERSVMNANLRILNSVADDVNRYGSWLPYDPQIKYKQFAIIAIDGVTFIKITALDQAGLDPATDTVNWREYIPLPIGTILQVGQITNLPYGFLPTHGGTIPVADYPRYNTRFGTTFGGDGITTTGIPDTRGKFIRAMDNSAGIDIGRVVGSIQAMQLEAHRHIQGELASSFRLPNSFTTSASVVQDKSRIITTTSAPENGRTFQTSIGGYQGSGGVEVSPTSLPVKDLDTSPDVSYGTETRPINIAMHHIIKVK